MELLHNAIEGVENARYNFRHALKRKFETSNQRVSIFFFYCMLLLFALPCAVDPMLLLFITLDMCSNNVFYNLSFPCLVLH